jgi:hypothetical protein
MANRQQRYGMRAFSGWPMPQTRPKTSTNTKTAAAYQVGRNGLGGEIGLGISSAVGSRSSAIAKAREVAFLLHCAAGRPYVMESAYRYVPLRRHDYYARAGRERRADAFRANMATAMPSAGLAAAQMTGIDFLRSLLDSPIESECCSGEPPEAHFAQRTPSGFRNNDRTEALPPCLDILICLLTPFMSHSRVKFESRGEQLSAAAEAP